MPNHSETKFLPFEPDQMFDLVADVAKYPEFLPWCSATRIRSHIHTPEGAVLEADMVISFKVFRERFGSQVTLFGKERIETRYIDGPFKHLLSTWGFRVAEGGCYVDFSVDFEFKNKILQGAAGLFFHEAMQRIVGAFEDRAKALYG